MPAIFRLIRLGNVLVSFAGAIVGGLIVLRVGDLGASGMIGVLTLAGVSTACVTAAGNSLNDLGDQETDRVNHPDRPLVTGELRASSARALTAGLFVAAVVLASYIVLARRDLAVALILAFAIGSLLVYEFRLKAHGAGGNVLIALLTAAVFLYGGAAVGSPAPVVPFAAMAFFATFSREVIKDMEDVRGDVDRRTLPQTRGNRVAGAVARGSVGIAIALSATPFLFLVPLASAVGIIYAVLVGIGDGVFVVSVLWLPERLHREQSLSKLAMAVALLAFLSVAFR